METINESFLTREGMIKRINFLFMSGALSDVRVVKNGGIYTIAFNKQSFIIDGEFNEPNYTQTLETT